MNRSFIEAENLKYSYEDGAQVLDGISFHVESGESVALVGANGAGKSTLLLHMNGCLIADEGSLSVNDTIVNMKSVREIRKIVGMVFQDPDDQLFMPTVRDDVAFGPLNLGLSPMEVAERVEDALSRVNASHLMERPPYRLSSGEKRAVAIASVLSMRPDILVMDEPTANLDPFARRKLLELLASFSHTLIVATHDLDMALELCDRTIVLYEGTVKADGRSADIFRDSELLASCRLEAPPGMKNCPVCSRPRIL